MMRKKITALGLGVGLLGGGAAGFAFTSTPGLAGAQDTTTTTVAADDNGTDTERTAPGDRIRTALQGLVTDGTLTQAQLDKVIETLQAARPDHGGGHGHGGPLGDRDGYAREALASSLKLTVDEVEAALRDGTTIAALAEQQGVEVDAVIDALVAAQAEHVASRVESGDITQAQADMFLQDARERITARVNGERPEGGPGRRGGHGGRGIPDDSESSDTTTTAPAEGN